MSPFKKLFTEHPAPQTPCLRYTMTHNLLPEHNQVSSHRRPLEGIWELAEDPKKLVRVSNFHQFHRNPGDPTIIPQPRVEQILHTGRIMLSELRDQYHIAVPAFFSLIAEQPGRLPQKKAYTVVEKIDGTSLEHLTEPGSVPPEALDDLCKSLAQYQYDKFQAQKPYLFDIFKYWQYMYGTSQSDVDTPQLFLVDIDPLWDDFQEDEGVNIFSYYVAALGKAILHLEKVHATSLPGAREAYQQTATAVGAAVKPLRRDSVFYDMDLSSLADTVI